MKINCPYIDSNNRCTHKNSEKRLRSKYKHAPTCPYNKPNKCPMWNIWNKEIKAVRRHTNASEGYVLDSGVII